MNLNKTKFKKKYKTKNISFY